VADAAAAGMTGTNGRQAANAIRTTDAFPKLAHTQVEIGGATVRIGGVGIHYLRCG